MPRRPTPDHVIEGMPEGVPVPVEIVAAPAHQVIEGATEGVPVPVVVVAADGSAASPPPQKLAPLPDQRIQHQATDPSVAAKTTFQEDLTTASQRRVNLIWEYTQAIIAVTVTTMTLGVASLLVFRDQGDEGAFLLLSNVFFLVIGTYFQRTNHVKTGGVQQHSEKSGQR